LLFNFYQFVMLCLIYLFLLSYFAEKVFEIVKHYSCYYQCIVVLKETS
jgi:hypothetical protein